MPFSIYVRPGGYPTPMHSAPPGPGAGPASARHSPDQRLELPPPIELEERMGIVSLPKKKKVPPRGSFDALLATKSLLWGELPSGAHKVAQRPHELEVHNPAFYMFLPEREPPSWSNAAVSELRPQGEVFSFRDPDQGCSTALMFHLVHQVIRAWSPAPMLQDPYAALVVQDETRPPEVGCGYWYDKPPWPAHRDLNIPGESQMWPDMLRREVHKALDRLKQRWGDRTTFLYVNARGSTLESLDLAPPYGGPLPRSFRWIRAELVQEDGTALAAPKRVENARRPGARGELSLPPPQEISPGEEGPIATTPPRVASPVDLRDEGVQNASPSQGASLASIERLLHRMLESPPPVASEPTVPLALFTEAMATLRTETTAELQRERTAAAATLTERLAASEAQSRAASAATLRACETNLREVFAQALAQQAHELRRSFDGELRAQAAQLRAEGTAQMHAHAALVRSESAVEMREQLAGVRTEAAATLRAQAERLRADFTARAGTSGVGAAGASPAGRARANRLDDSRLRRNLPTWLANVAEERPWTHVKRGFWDAPSWRNTLFAVPKAALSALIWIVDEFAAVVAWMHASGMLTLLNMVLSFYLRAPRVV